MPGTKLGRPFVYQSDDEKPVSFSVRIPRELYGPAKSYADRHRMTLTELLLDGLRLRLETPADPRDLLASDKSNTVMQELQEQLQEMVDTAVQLALIEGRRPVVMAPEAPAPPREEIPSYNGNTVIHGRGDMRRRILDLLYDHQEGLSSEQLRAFLKPEKPIGDTLQGMRRQGVVRTEGSGKAMRYFVG